mmetsp:Transcript_9995/g.34505  ORF Transcript_9995/g.34505 Transcript_9995/m.34505 type:complete len:235 (-) Transcript_9995:710-1414(-)
MCAPAIVADLYCGPPSSMGRPSSFRSASSAAARSATTGSTTRGPRSHPEALGWRAPGPSSLTKASFCAIPRNCAIPWKKGSSPGRAMPWKKLRAMPRRRRVGDKIVFSSQYKSFFISFHTLLASRVQRGPEGDVVARGRHDPVLAQGHRVAIRPVVPQRGQLLPLLVIVHPNPAIPARGHEDPPVSSYPDLGNPRPGHLQSSRDSQTRPGELELRDRGPNARGDPSLSPCVHVN